MANKLNRNCIVCAEKYSYCNSCKEHSNLEPWHSIFCSSNCREIFNVVSMYEKISNDDIKARLDKCDLSNKQNFHKNIIKVIDTLYSSDVETPIVEEIVEDIIETPIEKVIKETVVEKVSETDIQEEEIKSIRTYKSTKRK